MVEKLSEKDRSAVTLLRQRIAASTTDQAELNSPYFHRDFNLLRWLQGYDYNTKIVEEKLRHHLKFRKDWQLDQVQEKALTEDALFVKSHWKGHIIGPCGSANMTSLLYVDLPGFFDFRGILRSVSAIDLTRFYVQHYENNMQQLYNQEDNSGRQWGYTVILDMEELSIDTELLQDLNGPVKCLAYFIQDHYPEVMQKCIVVNCSSLVYWIWNAAKRILPQKTQQKIVILGHSWGNEIFKFVDEERLPKCYGGTLDDSSILSRKLNAKIPTSMYWSKEEQYPPETAFKQLTISAGNTETVDFQLSQQNTTIYITFSADKEFGFSATFTNECDLNENWKEIAIYPHFRRITGPTLTPVRESIENAQPGIYKFQFRNDFSWFQNLTVTYCIQQLSLS